MEAFKWVSATDRSGDYKYLHTPFCTYEVRKSGKVKFKALAHGVWRHGLLTEYIAKTICEQDFSARVDTLARANGYVKLQPAQAVVKGDDIKELLHLWISHGPRFAEINRVMRVFAGAVALVECSTCRGSGTIRVPHPAKPFAPDYIDNCDNCKGAGFVSAALDASGVK